MNTATRLSGINEYYFSQKLREIDQLNAQGKNVINLGIGSPDLPPHPSVIESLTEAARNPSNHAYQGYKGSSILRKAISEFCEHWYGFLPDADKEILPLIGSKEGVMHICMTFLEEGDIALVPDPGYPTYAAAIELAGAAPVFYDILEEKNYYPDLEQLSQQVKNSRAEGKQCKLLFVNYPHMPTGQSADQNIFRQLIDFARTEDLLIIHDNPYSFILNDKPASILSIPGAIDHAIELNSLSKSHNMAGWRVGMMIGREDYINQVLKFKSNMDSGMFLPVQLAASTALKLGTDWFHALNNQYARRRKLVFALLDLLHCKYDTRQSGLFVWARVPQTVSDGYALSDRILKDASVFITPGGIFGNNGKQYVRVSLCSNEVKLMESINRIKECI
jgi:LL-diaminopimelate aminotransferase